MPYIDKQGIEAPYPTQSVFSSRCHSALSCTVWKDATIKVSTGPIVVAKLHIEPEGITVYTDKPCVT